MHVHVRPKSTTAAGCAGESETFTDMIVTGCLPYMAPEVFEGNYGTKADVWSVGVIIYQLITGRLPFPSARANDGECVVATRKKERKKDHICVRS